jgi:hypothetical protein
MDQVELTCMLLVQLLQLLHATGCHDGPCQPA